MSTTPAPDPGDPVDRLLRTTAERWREEQTRLDESSYDAILARAVGSSPGPARRRPAPVLASSWRVAAVAASVLVLAGGVVGIVGATRGHDRVSVPSSTPDPAPTLPTSRVIDGTTVVLRELGPAHMIVSGGPASRQLSLELNTLGRGNDDCHWGEVAEIVRQEGPTVEIMVGRYSPALDSVARPDLCPTYAVPPHRQVLELAAPLGDRTVVDASTGQPAPVLDASTTPYATATLAEPYVLESVAPGPVVTWTKIDYGTGTPEPRTTVTLRPSAPAASDETDLGKQKFGDRTVSISARKGSITARWQEDPTHAWMITVDGPGDYVRGGEVFDYGGLDELVSSFTSPG